MALMGAVPPSARFAALQPAHRSLAAAETLFGQRDYAGQAVQAIGFETRQPSASPSALQAPRREIEGVGQLLERKPGSSHQLFDHRRREAFADGIAKVALGRQVSSQNTSTAQFLHHGAEFVYHLSSIIATIVAHVNFPRRRP